MNKLIVGTHQPNYIPWLGYFFKISRCNLFVFLDDVQFSKTGAHNYHYIKTKEGSMKLKIPVKHKYTDPINKVITNDHGGWKDRHLKAIRDNYEQSDFFNEVYPEFKSILNKNYNDLSELNIAIVIFFVRKFELNTEFIKSSEIDLGDLKNEARIIEICKKTNGTIYYSGRGAKAYQITEHFTDAGIELVYDNFKPTPYKQLFSDDFLTNVSIIDYVMNHGYDWEYIESKILKNINENE